MNEKKSENQILIDFLSKGPPEPPVIAKSVVEKEKNGLFSWRKKKTEKDEAEFRGTSSSSPVAPPPSTLSLDDLGTMETKYGHVSEKTGPVQEVNPPNILTSMAYNFQTILHSALQQPQQQVEQDPQHIKEDIDYLTVDTILLKNTDFNASFIHVDDLGKSKPRNSGKGVSFMESAHAFPIENEEEEEENTADEERAARVPSVRTSSINFADYYNEEEQQRQNGMCPGMKPNFGSRGSSLKNLGQIIPNDSKEYRASVVPDAFYRSNPPQNDPQASPRFSYTIAKSNDGHIPAQLIALMPPPSITAMAPKQLHLPLPSSKPPTISRARGIDVYIQTEHNIEPQGPTNELLAYVSSLEAQLKESRNAYEEQVTLGQEQKRGFDKLSAQAYRKIKELLTDRNIMSIEIKSFKAQVYHITITLDGKN